MFCEAVGKLPSEYLHQLYFDSLVYTTENLSHLIDTVGASQVVIGTDFPFAMGNEDSINHVLSVEGLTPEQQASILGGTAAHLLGLD
jgi:aminocarboxymuconate-semialdehyde decarboxylase